MPERLGVTNAPVVTDETGFAQIPYPKFIAERVETKEISFSVSHPDFVPDRPFRTVSIAPPLGAPWRILIADLWKRIIYRVFFARPEPVVLQQGAILKIVVQPDPAIPNDAPVFAQSSAIGSHETNFWLRPEPGVIMTRRLSPGLQTARVIRLATNNFVWFSDVITVTAVAGRTNDVTVALKPGVNVHGQLDATVPRPVRNGRVVANVWPQGHKPEDSPPQWHAWTTIRDDGTFDVPSLPQGDLEIVALCAGFVSTNGPGQFKTVHRYPQKHVVRDKDLAIIVGMEPTARLEVRVTDDKGRALKDAQVGTWPNVRYGEWAATILMGDCYNTWDRLRGSGKASSWWQPVPDFVGVTDASGLAVLPNLPVTVKEFSVGHPKYVLPAITTGGGSKRREASITLIAGQTNRTSVQLEPHDQAPLSHY